LKRRIIRHDQAVQDIIAAALHIAEDNVDAAERLMDATEMAIHRLSDMPGVGVAREIGSSRRSDLHSWPVPGFPNYLIFYRFSEDEVEIVRVLHGARDIDSIFDD
jgi:toxin ParE1/3/4